jgi:hypothetical protein
LRLLRAALASLGLAECFFQRRPIDLIAEDLVPSSPTVFSYKNTIIFPAGEKLFDLIKWQPLILQANVTCDVKARARVVRIAP